MLPSFALCSLADARHALNGIPSSASVDDRLESIIAGLSRATEQIALRGRRAVFRAPIEDDDAIVASVLPAAGPLTLAGQPNSAGRVVVVTVTDADRSITAGTITVTGTVAGVPGTTETFDLSLGVEELFGGKFFTAISAASVGSDLVGPNSTDRIKLGTSKGYVEYHSPGYRQARLFASDCPIYSTLEVNEDGDRAYGSSTALLAGTDYLENARDGVLTRLSGDAETWWTEAPRAVRHTYSGGYIGLGNVPDEIRWAVAHAVARVYDDVRRQAQNKDSESNALGSVGRVSRRVVEDLLDLLGHEARWSYGPQAEREV